MWCTENLRATTILPAPPENIDNNDFFLLVYHARELLNNSLSVECVRSRIEDCLNLLRTHNPEYIISVLDH